MTTSQAHNHAVQLLGDNHYPRAEAHVTARILLDTILGASHVHLTRGEEALTAPQLTQLEVSLKELVAGRPLAYILGQREFFGLDFSCDERALIPRPETELLVEFALARHQENTRPGTFKLADLGTGTGCVAISIAKNCPQAVVFATDVSATTLELARENTRILGVEAQVQFVAGMPGDWAGPLLNAGAGPFDVIVSNPPYIAPHDIAQLPVQIREFEPRGALDGGPDGLDCYRQIAAQCGALLTPEGHIACELGIGQFADVRRIFEENGWHVGEAIRDFQDIERVLTARRADYTNPVN